MKEYDENCNPSTLSCLNNIVSALTLCQCWTTSHKLLDSSVQVQPNHALLIPPDPWNIYCRISLQMSVSSFTAVTTCCLRRKLGWLLPLWITIKAWEKSTCLLCWELLISSPSSEDEISRLLLLPLLSLVEVLVSLSAQWKKSRRKGG